MDSQSHERWQHLSGLFAQAVALTGVERDAFVESVGTRDAELCAELERLLRAHEAASGDFLQPIDATRAAALIESTPEDEPPERIGHYAIVRRLGGGGMGVVYLAYDTRLNRQVALKLLRRGIAADARGSRRLLAEAQAASALDHPNTVPVYEVGEAPDGRLFIAMAYAGDVSLADRIRRGPLDTREAVALGRQLADALAAAHRLGIVHRDVKPSNVILSPEGRARLVDFGIASISGGDVVNSPAAGTLAYMSPEQTRGDAVDHSTDIWSLGVVLYEMLAGRRPFRADDEPALIHAIRNDAAPSLRMIRPDVPDALVVIVERCLARSPDDRPAGADAVAAELAAFLNARVVDDDVPRRRRRLALIAGATIAVLGAAAILFDMRQPAGAPELGSLVVLPFAPVTTDTALQRLGRELVVTLSNNLDGAGGLRVVEPITVLSQHTPTGDVATAAAYARRLGARQMIYGQLTRAGDAVRLDAAVYGTADLRVHGRAWAAATLDDVAALTDSATLKLLLATWPDRDWPLPNVAAITTSSVPALRAYLEGEVALAGARFRAAPLAFARAMEADSSFWFAYWRYMYARDYHGLTVDSVIRSAVFEHRASLPEPDRMMVEVRMSTRQTERLALREAITDRFPNYWPAWFDLADQRVHHGVFLGHSFDEARSALQRTVELNPRFVPAWEHQFWLAVHARDSVRSGQILARLTELGADSLLKREWDLQTLDYYRYLERLVRSGGEPIAAEAEIGARVLADYRGPLAPERLAVSMTNYGFFRAQLDLSRRTQARGAPATTVAAHDWGTALAWAGRGDWDAAFVALQRYTRTTTHPRGAVWSYGLAAAGTWLGALDPAAAQALRASAVRSEFGRSDTGRAEVAWLDGIIACARGDAAALRQARERLAISRAAGAGALVHSLRAFDAVLAGEAFNAAAFADAEFAAADSAWAFRHGANHPIVIAINRLTAGRLLLDDGDTATADRMLRLHETDLPGTLQPLPAIHLVLGTLALPELARIAEARGANERARQYRSLFAERSDRAPAAWRAAGPAPCAGRLRP